MTSIKFTGNGYALSPEIILLWLLAAGVWNDGGVWDDTALWID